MPAIYSSTNDGFIQKGLGSWASQRSSASGIADNNNTINKQAVQSFYSGRGGGTYGIYWAFFEFDTSGISEAPDSATLKIYGYSSSTADVIAVRSEHSATLANGDFDALYGASTELGNSDGSGGGTLAGVSGLTYSSELTSWSTSGYNDIVLNATALSDMASLDTFKVCLMEHDHDYLDVEEAVIRAVGFFWADYTSTSRDPYIDYTAATAATDNAIFFGTNF